MRGSVFLFALLASILVLDVSASSEPMEVWAAPFDSNTSAFPDASAGLTLEDALRLVAIKNPSLQALISTQAASEAEYRQAGAWLNPELEAELEEIGLDAPGFEESEMTISLVQELELFGQRAARRRLAQASMQATGLAMRLSAFDLYLEAKARFFELVHAQIGSKLADSSVALAAGILDDISLRFGKGAALQSELMLARLELERSKLEHARAGQDLLSARVRLAALWGDDSEDVSVIAGRESDLMSAVRKLSSLISSADSSREAILLQSEARIIEAERQLAFAEARPTISLLAGYRRLQGDGSNSLILGIGVPLPLWNRNKDKTDGLEAQMHALQAERQRARFEVLANIRSATLTVNQLAERHAALDSVLLPTARGAYDAVRIACEAGRLPFTELLNAERSLIELSFAHNDVLLAIRKEIIALERLTGVVLTEIDK